MTHTHTQTNLHACIDNIYANNARTYTYIVHNMNTLTIQRWFDGLLRRRVWGALYERGCTLLLLLFQHVSQLMVVLAPILPIRGAASDSAVVYVFYCFFRKMVRPFYMQAAWVCTDTSAPATTSLQRKSLTTVPLLPSLRAVRRHEIHLGECHAKLPRRCSARPCCLVCNTHTDATHPHRANGN